MIRDIPEGVDEEFLITYLEARLQLDIKTDFTVEIRHSCALITFVKQLSEEGKLNMPLSQLYSIMSVYTCVSNVYSV